MPVGRFLTRTKPLNVKHIRPSCVFAEVIYLYVTRRGVCVVF